MGLPVSKLICVCFKEPGIAAQPTYGIFRCALLSGRGVAVSVLNPPTGASYGDAGSGFSASPCAKVLAGVPRRSCYG
jgi:hypothetical protein